jgi:S-sulfo-L-cysteine synthase (O-acetyl-L-serine-dependent)
MNSLELIEDTSIDLKKRVQLLGNYIGNTPLYPIRNLSNNPKVKIFAKAEWLQFGGSVKSRPAYRIIKDAIEGEQFHSGKQLLDASSGNTGIAYAHIGAALGLEVALCIPENATTERKQILRALGVQLHFTSKTGTTDEAQEIAEQLYSEQPEAYYFADQYSNPSNWMSHFDTTGPEILQQTGYEVTHFIAGLGTTGTFTGVGRRLKKENPDIQLIGLQPDIPMHGLEGWKHLETAHVPEIYDAGLADEIKKVNTEQAYETLEHAARQEGLLLSPSSAANLTGALQLAEELREGVIVTVLPDDGSKYGEVMKQLF